MVAIHSSKHSKPRALITGLLGFTGQYLARELKALGYEVYGTCLDAAQASSHIFQINLCDGNALQAVLEKIEPDVVAHLAAISFVAHGKVDEIYHVNMMSTRNVLQGLSQLNYRPQSILIASSANVYGNSQAGCLNEEEKISPANDYAISKVATEYIARLYQDKLPLFITRPFNYTGVGQADNFLLPKIITHFKQNKKVIELGNIEVARDFSDVRFVAQAYAQLLHHPIEKTQGEIFNICSGQAYSLLDIIHMVEAMAGYTIEIQQNPQLMRANEIKVLMGNPQKLHAMLPQLSPIGLHATLEWMLKTV